MNKNDLRYHVLVRYFSLLITCDFTSENTEYTVKALVIQIWKSSHTHRYTHMEARKCGDETL